MRYLLLVFLWICWCGLHSALINPGVTESLRRKFPHGFKYYRILFNAISLVTLVPVFIVSSSIKKPAFFSWDGPWRILQILLLGFALFLFAAGARRYDLLQFVGFRQAKDENACIVITDDCSLDTKGVLSLVRHPWYTGGFLMIWAQPLDLSAILTNVVLSTYLVIGAMLEEQKLISQFGKAYKDYQKQVSMFFPIKWIRSRLM